MSPFEIEVYHYQYRNPNYNSSRPPYEYLESPQNIHERNPSKIIVRERGGPNDNHCQWISAADVVPLRPFRGTSHAHGVITNKSNTNTNTNSNDPTNNRGDKLWLRSDQPLLEGRNSAPVVNLAQLRSSEVRLRDVRWCPDKKMAATAAAPGNQGTGTTTLLTLIGHEFPAYSADLGRFRMCVMQNKPPLAAATGQDEDVLRIVTVEEMQACYEGITRRASIF
ncbi:hypothetical protein B0H63DRAFT_36342 [Podospora didyma]|uniref:Uncharacterized protein n=1 Tax=Podospora didyma TaxID=330526 RepID=A0AAE0U7R3_9PEZI|nr:hypothetical protein B0H63DRAFT_36342 [Podospora didyma]